MKPRRAGLWRVIYIARGEKQADAIEALLQQGGFMVDCRAPMNDAGEDIEIRALESEAEEARIYLLENGY